MEREVAVIICAAGASSRFGGKKKKPFVDVGGKAAFLYSVEAFCDRKDVGQVLMAISAEDQEMVNVKWGANLKFFGVKTYIGGSERFETVAKGLKLVKDGIKLVAIHDAVRCCVVSRWIDECFAEAAKKGAAILGCPVVATLKKVEDGKIIKTVERSGLYEAQTPQVFEAGILKQAYANIDKVDKDKISDDSQLVEAMGKKVSIIETDNSNIKITRKSDVAIAEAILQSHKSEVKKVNGPYYEAQW